jgi:Icc protein
MLIAHLSDLHILEPTERPRFDVRFVSIGRRLDAKDRLEKMRTAITQARAAGAEHFLFTGDLTETGTPAQFEAFATMLDACGLRADEVTLVPGNHDAYTSTSGWRDALEGPLQRWARNAAREPGNVVDLGDTFILPIDVTFHQPVTRSAGRLEEEVESAIQTRLADPTLARGRIVIAVHHPPHPRPGPWQWVDGLLGGKRLLSMIEHAPNVTVAHGHLHRHESREHGLARVVGAAAVVDGAKPIFFGEPRVALTPAARCA